MINLIENQQIEEVAQPLRMLRPNLIQARGWIRTIREALGMTAAQLAGRLGVHTSRIGRIEKDEIKSAVTLKTLVEAANALECDLVYALVPRKSIDEILKTQAKSLVQERLKQVQLTMALENQALDPHQYQAVLEQEVDALLHGPLKYIWDKPQNENN